MILRTLQKHGHKPIVLLGGGTTRIGDPSGKDESRQLLSDEIISNNAKSIGEIFKKYLQFGDGESDAVMVNNAEWLNNIKYIDFLRDYGRYFTINRMLTFESVKQRLAREQPLTFLEFNYMLLQAYDFVELSRRYNVSLQLGGSDQWGNIVGGVELGRKVDQSQLFGLTAPLLTTSDGKKMGKTASGAVWLNKELLSEYEYWQFWRNTADSDVIRFLKLFTELPLEQINEMSTWEGAQLNEAKIILADQVTSLLHGPECLEAIHNTVKSLYSKTSDISYDSLPKIKLDFSSSNGLSIVDVLLQSELLPSKNEARKAIKNGVSLVGAGPGDPDLLTIQALNLIKGASLVIADRLVSPEILSLIDCKLKVANKKPGCAEEAQEEIYAWVKEAVNKGENVVRLKIGDPFLFGRGGEEVLEYRKLGIEPFISPGLSSSYVAPLIANIPITHRDSANHVVITTGYGKNGSFVDIPNFEEDRTIVLLMAIGRINEIIASMIESGYPVSTPVAIIENATTPKQRILRGIIENIRQIAVEKIVKAPAIIVVGKVVDALQ
eukprot:gene17010-22512_t